ncbi:sialic acid-binding Ig-like lectin 5 isoform X1 [Sus scrofa]|uniref:sialic acid-binding Ig-like lectin 5 isoform X1 n=2 Tax=Sus scrofa TaxID=9823 RepID=UPI000A2B3E86|nr:sialic acid-binding Ig-like lectin 5 isoform X1 [Sus scrofa]
MGLDDLKAPPQLTLNLKFPPWGHVAFWSHHSFPSKPPLPSHSCHLTFTFTETPEGRLSGASGRDAAVAAAAAAASAAAAAAAEAAASLAQDSWYQLELQQNVTVQEGLCVLVPCKFSYPWSSFGTFSGFWFRQGAGKKHALVATNRLGQKLSEGSQGRFFLLGDPQANNCSLSIRDVTTGDSGTYFFQIETSFHQHAYQDRPLSLGVTALTQAPHILMPETLESGRPRRLTCSVPWACEWGTPPVFSWTSAALPTLGPRTPLSSVVTLTPRPQDHGTSLTCQVMFPASGVTVGRTIQLNVTYAPRNVTVSVFQGNRTALKILQNASSLPVLEGQALQLLCVADGNPPAQLSWFRGSPAPNATPISSTTILELPGLGTVPGEVTCRAQNPLGSQNLSLSLLVVYPPQLLGPSCSWEDRGLHCSCSSRAQPAPSLHWRLGEGLLDGNFSNASIKVTSSSTGPWANSSLSLGEGLSSSLRLSCEAQNVYGSQGATVLLLPGKPQPRIQQTLPAIGGAGIVVLLSFCLYLIFRVKTLRKTQPMQSLDAVNQAEDSGPREPQPRFWADTAAEHPAPAGAGSSPGEGQELHYALLRFHRLQPRPQEPEDTHTEYSEIRTHQ